VAPDDPRSAYLQAVLAARGGEYAMARSLLARSGMAARGVPAALLLDATISLAEGNPDSAADVLTGLTARQPANARLRDLLARALLASEREAELIERFGAEAQRAETSPYMLMVLARAHERVGDRASAAPLLERAAQTTTSAAPVVLADRAGLPPPAAELRQLALAGNWAGAQSAADRLRAQFPLSADMANFAGDVALGAGNGRAALEHYAVATRVRRPWRLAAKGVAAYRLAGDQDAAFALLARHVGGEPDNLDAVMQLATEAAAAEDWVRSAVLLDHVIGLGGGHDPALLRLRLRAARALDKTEDAKRFAALLAAISPPRLAPR
jgi:predicted Zn-dependent protease